MTLAKEWVLTDVESDALSIAVLVGREDLGSWLLFRSESDRATELARLQGEAEILLETGTVLHMAGQIRIQPRTGMRLAALAERPGGFRIAQIVFCAKHYPAGIESRWRFGCDVCDPDSRAMDAVGRIDGRDVVTAEVRL